MAAFGEEATKFTKEKSAMLKAVVHINFAEVELQKARLKKIENSNKGFDVARVAKLLRRKKRSKVLRLRLRK